MTYCTVVTSSAVQLSFVFRFLAQYSPDDGRCTKGKERKSRRIKVTGQPTDLHLRYLKSLFQQVKSATDDWPV